MLALGVAFAWSGLPKVSGASPVYGLAANRVYVAPLDLRVPLPGFSGR